MLQVDKPIECINTQNDSFSFHYVLHLIHVTINLLALSTLAIYNNPPIILTVQPSGFFTVLIGHEQRPNICTYSLFWKYMASSVEKYLLSYNQNITSTFRNNLADYPRIKWTQTLSGCKNIASNKPRLLTALKSRLGYQTILSYCSKNLADTSRTDSSCLEFRDVAKKTLAH